MINAMHIGLGHQPGVRQFRKFGSNHSLVAAERVVQVGGAAAPYFPTAAVNVEVISGAAADASGGAGAQQVTIFGINENYDEDSEILTTNGQSASAASAKKYHRIHRVYVSRCGTYRGSNTGALTLRAAGAGSTFLTVDAGHGQSQTTVYTVARKKKLLIYEVSLAPDSVQPVDAFFWQAPAMNDVVTPFGGAKRMINDYTGLERQHFDQLAIPMVFDALTDLWFTAQGNGGGLAAFYAGVLCDV